MGPWAHGAGVGAAAPRHTSLWRAQRKLQGSSTSLAEHLRPGRKACAVVRSAFVGSRRPSRVSLGSLGPVSRLAAARPRRGDAFFGSLSSLAIPTWAVCCAPVLYAHAWPCTFPLGHPRSACAVEVIYIRPARTAATHLKRQRRRLRVAGTLSQSVSRTTPSTISLPMMLRT